MVAAHIAAVALARRLRPPYAPLASVSARAKRSACTYTHNHTHQVTIVWRGGGGSRLGALGGALLPRDHDLKALVVGGRGAQGARRPLLRLARLRPLRLHTLRLPNRFQ